ncbi:hypothetical protein ACFSBZ_11540 [Amnibacterium flavum]|uniref:Uncharacterized protein n=1 Tax=Amnibacterium flavum TaxID=2173173 RepID=A0A2V1HS67_9MICO|nr:hypothetical protein [Amnibacterium flavum]PVZ95445.1 hypothetical protein DDQ50_02755 [Amnibacterium flavum]
MTVPDSSPAAVPEAPAEQTPRRARRTPVVSTVPPFSLWLGAAVATVLVFIGVVIALNSSVYSASGFVERYLAAIERRDLATLVETAGVEVPAGADASALTRSALVAVDEARVVEQTDSGDGTTSVRVDWRDGSARGTLQFDLVATDRLEGLFTDWRFAVSPITAVPVTALHAPGVSVNGVAVTAPEPSTTDRSQISVAAFMPSRLNLGYDTRDLSAQPVVTVAGASEAAEISVDVQPTDRFIETVQTELDDFLDACATQQVLQPSGCPFGTFIEDRLLAPPTWSIVAYPAVTIVPGSTVGQWLVPETPATAHIAADVLSLFDGSQTRLDEDVPFTVDYRIEIGADGALQIIGDE